MDCADVSQGTDSWLAHVNRDEPSGSIREGNFLTRWQTISVPSTLFGQLFSQFCTELKSRLALVPTQPAFY